MFNKTTIFSLLIIICLSQISYTQTLKCNTKDPFYVNIQDLPNTNKKSFPESFCMYSGQVDIQTEQDNQVFFMHFPSSSVLSESEIPLTVIVNNQPGRSVLSMMAGENGPIQVTESGLAKKKQLEYRQNSWTNYMSVLYIDVQNVGFSSTNDQYSFNILSKLLTQALKKIIPENNKQQITLLFRGLGSQYMNSGLQIDNNIKLVFQDPVQESDYNILSAMSTLGVGITGKEYENTVKQFIREDRSSKSINTIRQFLEIQSKLDIYDVRQNLYNDISIQDDYLSTYMTNNIDELRPLLHISNEKQQFNIFNEKAQDFLLDQQIQKLSIKDNQYSIIYDQFNLFSGAQQGNIFIEEIRAQAYKKNKQQIIPKELYSTGVMSEQSGINIGYMYQVNSESLEKIFVMSQGGYFNTWYNQSAEIIYNIATEYGNFCYYYNQRNCLLPQNLEQYMDNCSGNGKWDSKTNKCQCNTNYAGQNCAYEIRVNNGEQISYGNVSLKPRSWSLHKITTEEAVVVTVEFNNKNKNSDNQSTQMYFQVTDEVPELQTDIDVSNGNLQSMYFEEKNEIVLNNYDNKKMTKYISLFNPDYTDSEQTYNFTFDETAQDDGSTTWNSSGTGKVFSIIFFTLGIVFVVGGGILYFLGSR